MKDLLVVKDLKTWFPIKSGIIQRTTGYVKAVDGISFNVYKGETFGLVGESGSGKTTAARSILRLIEPIAGEVYFEGASVTKAKRRELRKLRRRMQIIFQDPYASLDPRQTVNSMLMETMKIHGMATNRSEAHGRAVELLQIVGLSEEHLYRFAHEFSGGQRQRVAVARVLAVNPEFIMLDEPTSFLDVSVQAKVLNLLKELQNKLNLTYLFISHNLAVVHHMSNRVGVMYLGKIVELADKDAVYHLPKHPYTFHLMAAIPLPDPEAQKKDVLLMGDVPSPVDIPPGCRFHPRCPYVTDRCKKEEPPLYEEKGHFVACHYDIDFESGEVKSER
ncbi:MAG: ABC transporter ATP-binding protein [Candidatus Bathyarchaeota archaeon]|nr:ABC transporter ATP-binding protein [Candidatus Bathyarchaeota archaeon]